MNQLLLNGNPINFPLSPESQFHEMLTYLKRQIDPNSALISSIRIDGNEIPNTEDQALGTTPVSHFELIEIFTTHPKEVADETLYDLIEFSKALENLATTAAQNVSKTDFMVHFNRLLEGITTFTEAVSGVKRVLKLGLFNSIQLLESNLLSILREVLQAHEQRNTIALAQLISEDLQENLRNWRNTGLPSLIRSRDS